MSSKAEAALKQVFFAARTFKRAAEFSVLSSPGSFHMNRRKSCGSTDLGASIKDVGNLNRGGVRVDKMTWNELLESCIR